MSDRAAELDAALLAADTSAAILAALARACWHNAHAGAECPPARVPTLADLAAWTASGATEAARTEAAERLTALVPPDWRDAGREAGTIIGPTRVLGEPAGPVGRVHVVPDRVDMAETQRYLLVTGLTRPSMATVAAPSLSLYGRLLADAHRRWIAAGGRHPLAPLVADWQEHSSAHVPVDRHVRAIMPASLRDATRDHDTLPRGLDRLTPLGPIREPEQGHLPGLEPPPSLVPPVPWLTLYDLTGSGPVQNRGRGAPLAQRLFVEVLTAVPRDAREWTAAPPVTLRDLFTWLWPRYWDREKWNKQAQAWGDWAGGYDRSKHLEPLRRALIELDNLRILYDRYERRLIRVDDLPTAATALDDPLRFHVRHLPGSDRGPMLNRAPARRWGVASAPAWRSTIRLAYLWDEAKARNNGARVYATRPVVARVAGGPGLLGTDGKPLRDRRSAVVTDWSDPRAVVLGADGNPAGADNPPAVEPNPARDRVPVLGPDDLIRLAYDEYLDHLPAGTRRQRLFEARKALRDKEAAGEVVIEEHDGDAWRIIESRPTAPER